MLATRVAKEDVQGAALLWFTYSSKLGHPVMKLNRILLLQYPGGQVSRQLKHTWSAFAWWLSEMWCTAYTHKKIPQPSQPSQLPTHNALLQLLPFIYPQCRATLTVTIPPCTHCLSVHCPAVHPTMDIVILSGIIILRKKNGNIMNLIHYLIHKCITD